MSTTKTLALWVAYGTNGVVGSIRHDEDGYAVTMAGADATAGIYPSLESAKGALHARMTPGSAWPRFQQH
ncbi:methyltransferase [Microbacterium sp. p3-SID336]|uniref:methyltransferase n=1 Tax=Microbacterium sp. p3-SID336 TaxID=2916212 RepID=UPI0021A6FD14|nr:methyltransferase [Microbacterium sp. p3-SID336]MCT1476853.1 methyltransferase [Microbacterium sp. p3-SID336]